MDALIQFSIPVKGLRYGVYEYRFHLEKSFFACFESSPVEDGNVEVLLHFDKQPGMFVLELDISGTVRTDCDRCLAPINLPIRDLASFVVKFSADDETDDADVVYIHPDTLKWDVSSYVYEYVILAIPMLKTYDCENDPSKPCDLDIVGRFLGLSSLVTKPDAPTPEPEPEASDNPAWDILKSLNKDNYHN
jgi:uncharacterized protein